MSIQAILFDADGVIQKQDPELLMKFAKRLGNGDDEKLFLSDLFAVEKPGLSGEIDLIEVFRKTLSRWNYQEHLNELLKIWTSIEIDHEIMSIIKDLRNQGTTCFVASNQPEFRAKYMSEKLGYKDDFDGEFYSFQLKTTKPNKLYFQKILHLLDLESGNVAFLDDRQENVDAAEKMGIKSGLYNIKHGSKEMIKTLQRLGVQIK